MISADLRNVYDALVQYASAEARTASLTQARHIFIGRTGDLFESDDAFERRICAFLEWYTLDRLGPDGRTLLHSYAQTPQASPHQELLRAWELASLSLFSIYKMRADSCILDDLLLSQRFVVPSTASLVGLAAKDIIAARVVVFNQQAYLTDGISYFPKAAAKVLGRISKSYRKGQVPGVSKLDLVHRLIYLTNRCDRYRHVDPKRIFAEGEKDVTQRASAP